MDERAGASPARLVALHRHLLLADAHAGEEIVGTCAIALLISIGSGLFLWWPRGGAWRGALLVRRGSRRLRSVHTTVAVWLFVPLIVIVVSGILTMRPEWLASFAGESAVPVQAARVQSLHADLMAGTPGRALVCIVGLSLPVLYVSGVWVWMRRRWSTVREDT